jgi:hypothetical protein
MAKDRSIFDLNELTGDLKSLRDYPAPDHGDIHWVLFGKPSGQLTLDDVMEDLHVSPNKLSPPQQPMVQ